MNLKKLRGKPQVHWTSIGPPHDLSRPEPNILLSANQRPWFNSTPNLHPEWTRGSDSRHSPLALHEQDSPPFWSSFLPPSLFPYTFLFSRLGFLCNCHYGFNRWERSHHRGRKALKARPRENQVLEGKTPPTLRAFEEVPAN